MRIFRSFLFAVSLCASTPLYTSVAHAQDDATIEMARQRFEEGVRYFDKKEYDKARAAFLQAYALKRHPAVLLNLAQSELRSDRPADAATHFDEYLREYPDAKPEQRSVAEEGLTEAKQSVGTITVTVDVDDAEVFLGDQSLGRSPLSHPIYLAPGEHEFIAKKGAEQAAVTVSAVENMAGQAEIAFAPPPPRPAPVASAGEGTTDLAADTDSESTQSFFGWLVTSPVGITGMAVTVAGVGLGVTGAIVSGDRYDSADAAGEVIAAEAASRGDSGNICLKGSSPIPYYASACAERQDRIDAGDTWKTVSVASFITAGAAFTATVVTYLVTSPSDDEIGRSENAPRTATLVPMLGPDVRGVGLVGQF